MESSKTLSYKLKIQDEAIGSHRLQIECLANLNETIDEMFAVLEAQGRQELLEELCPYFGVVWPSARGLAQTLSERAEDIRNQTLLEIGCGLAVPSLLAAKLGALTTSTDFHPEVPRFLTRNIEINQVPSLKYVHLNWQKEADTLGRFDWVVGSDILYEKQHALLVAKTIDQTLKPGGTAIVVDPARPYLQAFVDEMKRLGFRSETTVLTVSDTPVSKDVFVVTFNRDRAR